MLPTQLLERLSVGRVTGLGLLLRRQAQLVEEDLAQLGGRVDHELDSSQVLDLLLQPVGLGRQLARQPAQPLDVDPNPGILHPAQHPHQGPLDLVVQLRHAPGAQGGAQRFDQPGHSGRPAGGVAGGIGAGARQIQLPGRRGVGGPQLDPGVAQGQILQQVLVTRGVNQVGGDGGIELEPGKDHAHHRQAPHQGFGVVGGHVDPVVAEQIPQRGSHSGVFEQRLGPPHHLDRAVRRRGQRSECQPP